MKKLLLPLLLVLASAPAFAQQPALQPALHAQPDKNDDTIVLTLPDEGRAAWQRAAGVLAARATPSATPMPTCSRLAPTSPTSNRTRL